MSDGQQRAGGLIGAVMREVPRLVSFGMIGIVNAVVNYLVTVGLTVLVLAPLGLAGSDAALGAAKALGWAVAVTNSYLLNTTITFARESGRKLAWSTYGRFVASGTLGLAVEVASFLIAVRYLPLSLAAVVPVGCAFIANFTMTRLVVFPARR